jgi:rRNA maturation protein Rpf1
MSRKAVLERTLGKKAAKKFLPKDNSEVVLEIPTELADTITRAELSRTLESLTTDLKQRKKGKGSPIFELDREVDISILEGHVYCFKTVLEYYGGPLK